MVFQAVVTVNKFRHDPDAVFVTALLEKSLTLT